MTAAAESARNSVLYVSTTGLIGNAVTRKAVVREHHKALHVPTQPPIFDQLAKVLYATSIGQA
jgi:hypothetical protein